jgi:hypothetical protein
MAQRINQQYPTSLEEFLRIEYLRVMKGKRSHEVVSKRW